MGNNQAHTPRPNDCSLNNFLRLFKIIKIQKALLKVKSSQYPKKGQLLLAFWTTPSIQWGFSKINLAKSRNTC